MPTKLRRWFAFSLRTLFVVVTLFAVWLGWELRIVRQRQAALGELRENPALGMFAKVETKFDASAPLPRPAIPLYRRWMGDEAIDYFMFDSEDSERSKRYGALFPEAVVLLPSAKTQ